MVVNDYTSCGELIVNYVVELVTICACSFRAYAEGTISSTVRFCNDH